MKIFSLALSLLLVTALNAQEKQQQELNCYNKWAMKFEERGADKVEDGSYDDVIVTNRQGAKAICYRGKVEVSNGIITRFFILLNDGTYEEFKRAWKNNSNVNVGIVNGISATMLSTHNELINVLWPSKIRPRKGMPVVAAEPVED